MPLLSLPNECFSDILSFLDNKSLYKCLFVNRFYCKLSIPLIWKDLFTTPISNKLSLINTLLSCLNEDEISLLIPYAINFNNHTPLFEYGKFVKKIDHEYCVGHIMAWLKTNDDQDCRVQKLISAIYHMIMRKGANLQEIDITVSQNGFYSSSHIIDLPKFSIFTTYKPGITNLRSLNIEVDMNSSIDKYQNITEFLTMLSKFCNSIVNYELFIHELNEQNIFINPFLEIIKLQPLVRLLMYINDHIDEENVGNVEKILYTLEFRSETLKELLFKFLDFKRIDLSFISKLEYLEHLEFIYCDGFTFNHCEALSKKKLCLKELKLWHCNMEIDLEEAIINSLCGEALLKLSLSAVTIQMIKTIKESCPNINFLCIGLITGKSLDSMIPLICELSSLKILNIKVGYRVDKDILIRILCNYLIYVEYLFFDFCMNIQTFRYFANNCRANLKKLIITLDNFSIRKDYLIHVKNFQMIHNSLKVLGIKKYDDGLGLTNNEDNFCWTCIEIGIVNLLKSQGIDIVSSNELDFLFY
ncbi:hypothetical protein C1645_878316 [Glomus cerebriforme]|uniref:F-box domain-containing protein n=1 Tax=Glomus cerebriforme TaxID=658196 RepID=A0A397SLI3_9GLOM|nr:hypothetical protein C1645_878316 [Glomus cerebriforme]